MTSWTTRAWHVAVLLLASAATGCQSKEVPVPVALSEDSDATLKAKHHAEDVFNLKQADGTYKALVFKLPKASDADSDYRVVFYRQQGNSFVRHGAENNLVNFQRPRLSDGAAPRIETTENRLGVRYHFVVDAKGAEMVPSEALDDAGALVAHPTAR
jgi:hypothetical protein